MTRAAIAGALCAAAAGCIGGVDPVQCVFASECPEGEVCTAGFCQLVPPTCPSLQPTFASINDGFFQVGCGAKSNKCHGDEAVRDAVSGLSLQTNPFANLVGKPADTVAGRPSGILRVKPGDAVHSLLIIKMKLKAVNDPQYGSSMPYDNPGAICDGTINVISQWIAAGAPNN
jgi:hypothetical protein